MEIIEWIIPKSNVSAIGSGGDIGGFILSIVVVLLAVAISMLLIYASTSLAKYKKFKRFFTFLGNSFRYAGYGLLTVSVIGLPVVTAMYLINIASENVGASLEILKWVGIILLIWFGLALLGYMTKNRIWKRIFKYHRELNPLPKQEEPEKLNHLSDTDKRNITQ